MIKFLLDTDILSIFAKAEALLDTKEAWQEVSLGEDHDL